MGFNSITFYAQIVNLFLLIWLLKHFLYRPILNIIDKRRQQIAHTIEEADDKLASASQLENDLTEQKAQFEKLRQKQLDELDRDILHQKAKMMKELELNYHTKREKLQDDLNHSWQTSQNNICEMIASEFMVLSQKVLSEWSDQNAMDQVVKLLNKKLSNLSKAKKAEVQKLLTQQKSIQIFVSDTLTKKQQDAIRDILSNNFTLPQKLHIQFKKKSSLILGIEMRLGNFLLDWNLSTYLEEVNQRLKQNISVLISSTKRKDDK